MYNKSGGKVRLTFKLEQDQLWIGTKGDDFFLLNVVIISSSTSSNQYVVFVICDLYLYVFALQKGQKKSQWGPSKML